MKKPKNVDEYIRTQPKEAQKILEQVRAKIKKAAPEAEEVISYNMPAYKIGHGRPIVFFAAFKHHIGLYPLPSAIEKFRPELKNYKYAKGSIQFPLDKPMPLDLISKIVKFKANEKKKAL